jgi:hypothetical protein
MEWLRDEIAAAQKDFQTFKRNRAYNRAVQTMQIIHNLRMRLHISIQNRKANSKQSNGKTGQQETGEP